ncbi:NAD(P)H-dependent glycerol-3-phosphate dehydrogenase [Acetanaerobacterium elongatum]|uniref:Glycerol-3-phosphate dehydrogenase [NAD(P)+] n=1 Tax=Acetanaerobacterium elongatum TaxID=258515 RepID=A0A1G9WYS6_9FIRM|nr:NAD(P)H-dependent glycerol-3-phosphate dehydrogenase [Acetanaerobacterium elongatum]SDM89275.1 glycerol 3-phosphate dehydrogenase (NAD(P)+) [Acetanaerobacterium elongatum]
MNIAILGAGGFGIALSVMAAQYGHSVTLWSAFDQEVALLKTEHENKKLLPGVIIPPEVAITTDETCVLNKEIILLAVPSGVVNQVAQRFQNSIPHEAVIVNVAKGLEEQHLRRLSQVLTELLPNNRIVVLSGPSHAEEVARGVPTTVVAASSDRAAAEFVQDALMNPTLRIYVNDDVVGVELGGALKNIIALAAGIADGLGLGDNSKAALMTRGITEMARLGVMLGGKTETFAGLSGIGDLIVTCTSMHSRNRRAGILIGEGHTAEEAIEQVGMTVEGYRSAKCAYLLAQQVGIEMPIINEIYRVLYEGKNAKQALFDLMGRSKKHESEEIWLYSTGSKDNT